MKPIAITIPLDPRTKKNHAMIAGSGARCPTCKRFLKQFVKQGRAYDEYAARAKKYLASVPKDNITGPVNVRYHFYMQTRRLVDQTNLTQAADDILVDCGILADDNSSVIAGHDGTRVYYDKDNPRTEILITDLEEP